MDKGRSPNIRSLLVLTMVSASTLFSGCATLPRETVEKALSIRKVGVSPKSFWPEKGEMAEIRWTQTREAKTALEILREDGEVIRRMEGSYPAGDHKTSWDGKDGTGRPVPAGVYLYVLRAQGRKGEQAVYNPSLTTGGEELAIEHFTFDRQTGQFNFVLPRAGRARLRVGLSPYLHLRTLLDWEPFEAGARTVVWDGLDDSRWIRAMDHPALSVNLAAFALADNAIIVKGNRGESAHVEHKTQNPRRSGLYLHALHDRMNCRDLSFQVELPQAKTNEEGISLLDGETLVRVRLQEADRNFMVNQRFEVMFFVDTVFLFEEEEGQDPFNFVWDTRGLAPGEHLLTVNLIGYEDHLGVKTVRVIKK